MKRTGTHPIRKLSATQVTTCSRVFDFIVTYKREHDGNSPTVRQIREACDLSSTSTTVAVLSRLERQGRIYVELQHSRSIQVIGGQWSLKQ